MDDRQRELEREIQALQESPVLLDAIPAPIFYKNAAGVYLGCNRAFEAYLGRPRSEIVGATVYDIAPRHLADVYRKADDELLARGGVQSYESRVRYADGTEHDVVLNKATFSRPDGTVGGLIGTILDITERKRAERALRESEERYRRQAEEMEAIWRLAPIGLAVLDRELRYRRVNERLAAMHGMAAEEHLGKTLAEVIPALAEVARGLAERVFATGEAVAAFEVRGETAAEPGVERFWNQQWVPLKDAAGQVWGINVVVEEITERKRMEAIRRREQEFRTLAERLPEVVARFDGALRCLYANPAAEKLTGWPSDRLIGRGVQELGLPAEWASLWVERLGKVFVTGREEELEFNDRTVGGPERDFDLFLIPEFAPDGAVETVIAVARDVTLRKQAESALRRAYHSLEQTLRELRATQQQVIQSEKLSALGALAAGVAHELNNPLMGVMGYVGLARRRVSDPQTVEMLERAGRELERMRDLLKNMLGFARPVEEQPAPVRLDQVVERALDLMVPEFKAQGIEVSKALPELPAIMAKEGALQQVFLNLLMNARDAVAGRPLRRVDIVGRREDGAIVIEVSDTGPGVPAALREKIFDPFFTTKPPGQGTGLGLSISQNIVTDMGGSIALVEQERGATVRVALPAQRATE